MKSFRELASGGGEARFAGSHFARYRETGGLPLKARTSGTAQSAAKLTCLDTASHGAVCCQTHAPACGTDDCVYDALNLRAAVASYADEALLSAPGTRFLYSNAGLNLVGRLIECRSGEPFADFVAARLLRPLGMADTTLWPSPPQLRQLAASYANSNGRGPLRAVPFPQLTAPYGDAARRAPSPAGGYFSSARDVARFGRMVLRGGELDGRRYLSARAVAEMTRAQVDGYGLGWSVLPAGEWDAAAGGGGGFGHGGAMGTKLFVHPRAGRVAVLMVHQDGGFDCDGVSPREHWWWAQRSALLFAR